MSVSVTQAYEAELAAKGFQSDPAQLRAVQALQRCADEWAVYKARRSNALKKLLIRPDIPKGVYMYGGVGRGKSFLMECFFDAVPLKRKVRLHFHEFMREVHRELLDLQGTAPKKQSIKKLLPRPTPPNIYTPRGISGRLISFLRALERLPLYTAHSVAQRSSASIARNCAGSLA